MTDDPGEQAAKVAVAIKRTRTARGMTLRSLAEAAGLSPGFLSMAERGSSSLSLTSLFAVAEALGVNASELLDGSERRGTPAEHAVSRADDAAAARITAGDRAYRVMTGDLPDQRLEGLLMVVRPTDRPSPVTEHTGEEFCYLLSGELVVHLPGEELVLGPGDTLHFKSRVPHALHNRGPGDARALWVVDHPLLHRWPGG